MVNSNPNDRTEFKQDIDRLGQGVDTLQTDVKALAHGAADAARSGVAELRQGAQHAVDIAKDRFESAKSSAADATESLKSVISRNPLASIGIAAGVGMLIALVMFRPRS